MYRFSQWLEAGPAQTMGATQTYIPDPNQTGEYVPTGSTASFAGGNTVQTQHGTAGNEVDPGVVQQIVSLKTIHGQLRDIFADIRQRALAFRSPSMRGAFEREMVTGIDSIGRSHAILAPSGEGGPDPG